MTARPLSPRELFCRACGSALIRGKHPFEPTRIHEAAYFHMQRWRDLRKAWAAWEKLDDWQKVYGAAS